MKLLVTALAILVMATTVSANPIRKSVSRHRPGILVPKANPFGLHGATRVKSVQKTVVQSGQGIPFPMPMPQRLVLPVR